jgi:putative membrane protein
MTTWQLLTTAWDLEPSVLLGCAGLLGAYALALRGRFTMSTPLFALGVLVLLLALVSPIDTIGDAYLFSAHMLQHLLLVLVVPPLLLLGTPASFFREILSRPLLGRIERALRQPALAWALGTGAVWVWHLPALYNAALANEGVHIIQHVSFLVTATIFWWPVVAPLEEHRMASLGGVGYLFAAALASSALGIILTFAPPGLYPTYLRPIDNLGALPLLRDGWGFTPQVDQQVGGLLMWVPGSLVFLCAMLATLARWYAEPEVEEEAGSASYGR